MPDSDRQTNQNPNDPEILHLKRAIADEILRQNKKRLEGDEGEIAKIIETEKTKLLNSLSNKKETLSKSQSASVNERSDEPSIIADAEKNAHKAVVEKINKTLIGDSKEAKQALINLRYDENNPKTISQLLQLKYESVFKQALEANIENAQSAEDVRINAEKIRQEHENDYLNELHDLIIAHSIHTKEIKNENDKNNLIKELAHLLNSENINEAIKKAQLEKQRLEDDQNWIDRALHQAMMFALSCGTTIGGAILLLIAKSSPAWLFATCVFLSPLVVLVVTKANWWLGATPVVHVIKDIVQFFRMNEEDREKEYKKYNKKWLITFAGFSVTGGIVWGVFTYDATIELLIEIGKEFSLISVFTAEGLASCLASVFVVKALYDIHHGLFIEKRRNSRIIQVVRGLVLLSCGAVAIAALIIGTPASANIAFAYAFSIFMGIYTIPTIFAVFYHFGKRWAYQEKETEFNDLGFFSAPTFNQKLEQNIKIYGDEAVNKRFLTWFLPVGIIFLASLCFFLSPYVAELLINADLIGYKESSVALESVIVSAMMGIAGIGTLAWKGLMGPSSSLSKAKWAFRILAFAAIWGAISVVLASAPITADFLQFSGVGANKSENIARLLVIGLGAFVTVWFFFSSAISSTLKLFSKKDLFSNAESLKNNSVDTEHGPNVNKVVEEVSHPYRTKGERISDSLTWIWHCLWPFTNDKNSRFEEVVATNGGFNATASAYGAFEIAQDVGSTLSAGASGAFSSIAANINGGIEDLPDNAEKIQAADKRIATLNTCLNTWKLSDRKNQTSTQHESVLQQRLA